MDIQVNKDQLERVAIKWLNIYYGDLKQKEFDDHPDEMFYVNSSDEIMMSHLKAKYGKYIYIDDLIFEQIKTIFNLSYDDSESIIHKWLKETYKLGGFRPYSD
jgi:hypothetical protein